MQHCLQSTLAQGAWSLSTMSSGLTWSYLECPSSSVHHIGREWPGGGSQRTKSWVQRIPGPRSEEKSLKEVGMFIWQEKICCQKTSSCNKSIKRLGIAVDRGYTLCIQKQNQTWSMTGPVAMSSVFGFGELRKPTCPSMGPHGLCSWDVSQLLPSSSFSRWAKVQLLMQHGSIHNFADILKFERSSGGCGQVAVQLCQFKRSQEGDSWFQQSVS